MRLLQILLQAPAEQALFHGRDGWVTAGALRGMAGGLLPVLQAGAGPFFVHTASLAQCVAALLAGACTARPMALPAHNRPAYLAEIGCSPAALIEAVAPAPPLRGQDLFLASEDPVLWFFTSGSTNAPKRVVKSLSLLEREAEALQGLWGREAGHVLATVSHQHIYGFLFRIVWPLLSQRTSQDCAAAYWEELEGRISGATLAASPAHLTRLPLGSGLFASPPALVFSSGQALDSASAQAAAAALGCSITEVLGSTETGGIGWRRQIPGASGAWTPLPQVTVSCDAEGALAVRSPYIEGEAALRTGDRIAMAPGGCFHLLGRGDRVVKVEGKRVSLARVEAALGALAEIKEAAALTLPERSQALAAVVVPSAAGAAQLRQLGAFRLTRQLRAACAALLEPAEQPKHWRFVDAIPTDAQGKRVLSLLRDLFAPASPLEQLQLEFRRLTDAEAEIAFTLEPDLIFFDGHFPNLAILPGVAQIHIAALLAQQVWADWRPSGEIARLKFQRPLFPGDALLLRLRREERGGRVKFSLHVGESQVAAGELLGVP